MCVCRFTSVSALLVLCGQSCCKVVCVLSLVGSFITVYFPMPVVISSGISVNCHPVTGRLHVGHRRPLLPDWPDRVCPGPACSDELDWESANPKNKKFQRKKKKNRTPTWPPITTSQSPGTSTRPGPVDELITESREERRGEERRGEERRECVSMCVRETQRGERAGPPTRRIQRHRIHSPFS